MSLRDIRFELEALEPRIMLSSEGADALAAGLGDSAQLVERLQNSSDPLDQDLPAVGSSVAGVYDPATHLDGLFDNLDEAAASGPAALADTLNAKADTTAQVVSEDETSVTMDVRATGKSTGVAATNLTPASTGSQEASIAGAMNVEAEWQVDLRITAQKNGGPSAYTIDPEHSSILVRLTAVNDEAIDGTIDGDAAHIDPGMLRLDATMKTVFNDVDGSGVIEADELTDVSVDDLVTYYLEGHAAMTAEMTEMLHSANAPPVLLLIQWNDLANIAPSSRTLAGQDDAGEVSSASSDDSSSAPALAPDAMDPDDPIVNGNVYSSSNGIDLAGIRVSAYSVTNVWTPVASGFTNASGAYSINWLGGGVFLMRAEDLSGAYIGEWYTTPAQGGSPWAEGGDVLTLGPGATRNGIDFYLDRAARITGIVTDVSTGDPIAGVQVEAKIDGAIEPEGTAVTGADGTYTIGGLPGGTYHVRTVPGAAGYLGSYSYSVSASAGAIASGYDFELEADTPITGIVTDPDGNGIVGVQVIARWSTSEWSTAACTLTRSTRSSSSSAAPRRGLAVRPSQARSDSCCWPATR